MHGTTPGAGVVVITPVAREHQIPAGKSVASLLGTDWAVADRAVFRHLPGSRLVVMDVPGLYPARDDIWPTWTI